MKPLPRELLERVREAIPTDCEVMPLHWSYEDEDDNASGLLDDEEDARLVKEGLLAPMMGDDEAHGSYTMCMGWPKRQKTLAGIR